MSVFKIFNTRNVIYVQNLNVIYSAISLIVLYFIVKQLFKEEITWNKLVGIAICLVGLFFINYKF